MGKGKKILIIGDYTKMIYHPLSGVDKELTEILSDFQVDNTDDYQQFLVENLKRYDLCISYTDQWKEKLTDEQTAGLLTYVCNGGGIIFLHNGIALQSRYELAQMVGAKFIGHPEMKELLYTPTAPEHRIM